VSSTEGDASSELLLLAVSVSIAADGGAVVAAGTAVLSMLG